MSAVEVGVSPYELLSVTIEATEQEIRTAYRQRSLKVHPDRNPNNPDAARKFHELNQAYELLLDPLRRLALDAKLRLKLARAERYKSYDSKRKNLVEELEERERAYKKARVDKEKEEMEAWRATEKIKEEGRQLREEKEKAAREKEKAVFVAKQQAEGIADGADEDEPPALDQFDTTVRLKYSLKAHPELKTKESIASYLSPFGSIDVASIVFSLKTKSKSKSKANGGTDTPNPTHATALVPFKNISDAFAAVSASSLDTPLSQVNLKGMEIAWISNKEPLILGWLKKMGKLPSGGSDRMNKPDGAPPSISTSSSASSKTTRPQSFSTTGSAAETNLYSSLPDFSSPPPTTVPTSTLATASGLDYESLTLLRLRQAERERLEREIREQEMGEEGG